MFQYCHKGVGDDFIVRFFFFFFFFNNFVQDCNNAMAGTMGVGIHL